MFLNFQLQNCCVMRVFSLRECCVLVPAWFELRIQREASDPWKEMKGFGVTWPAAGDRETWFMERLESQNIPILGRVAPEKKVLFELYLRWSLQTVSNHCILSMKTPELNQVAFLCLSVCDPPNDQACDKKAWMVGNTPELNWVDWIAASRCQDWRLARKPACPLHRWIGPINRRSWPHLVKYSWNI